MRASLADARASAIDVQGRLEESRRSVDALSDQLVEARVQLHQATRLAVPTVLTPPTNVSPVPPADEPEGPALAPTPPAAPGSATSRLSERLPDPDKFDGTPADLRRFTTQIRRKMTVNQDRYPTPAARIAYIADRLKDAAYALALPHLEDPRRLSDYEAVLTLLEKAYGDPDRVNRARRELYRLRQTHKDFNTHLAEFQRLALEGEMDEGGLPSLLENSLSRELQSMLLYHTPPAA